MPEDKRNVTFDEKEKIVTVALNPRLYPQSVIMRAAYRFTEDFDVVVDGDPLDKITAVFKVRKEDKKEATHEDLEELSDAFYSELLHASVEETQARRYADTRNALIGAAVSQLMSTQIDQKSLAENLRPYAGKEKKQAAAENPTNVSAQSAPRKQDVNPAYLGGAK